MKCIVCRTEVSRSYDAATEFTIWESEFGREREQATGRVAHVVCLRGESYDEQQMSITEGITKEENERGNDLG